MCGIFGSFGFIDTDLLKKALRLMVNRGPDSEGTFVDKDVMLGVRRLSIIDLKSGNQPIYNEDKSLVTVYNGEIFNYKELRAELEKAGHKFYTESDTETIVHCYEEYGVDFVKKLNGMFSIALYDSRSKKLFLYRDRYGEKPLYYYYSKGCFIFSSEIRPILAYEEIHPELNIKELPYYLNYRYFKNPDTFIRQIKKIVPGTFIQVSKEGIKEKRYYTFKKENKTLELSNLLDSSVNLRMRSDVPVGLFLSGGLDSTTILHYMRQDKEKIKTFTIGFEGHEETNELKNARSVSELYGTDHNEITISCNDAIKSLGKVIMHMEEPIADPTAVSSYFLSKAASKKVKVVLAGEGADEIFGGYNYYGNMQSYRRLKPLKPFFGLLKYVPQKAIDTLFNYPGGIGVEGRERLLELSKKSDFEVYNDFITLWKDYNIVLKEKLHFNYTPIKKDIYDEVFYRDITGWLPDYILTRVDKMTMASSIECRSPFLDYRLVDSYGGKDIGKNILRKVMSTKLPADVIKRRKFPFFTPLQKWFDEGMKEYYQSVFDESEIIRKLFDKKCLEILIDKHNSSPLISSRKLWSLMVLEKSISSLDVSY